MGNRPKIKGRFSEKVRKRFKMEELVLPEDEKVVIKEVPAKVDGEVVGTTLIYDDGTFSVILDENMSEESKEKLRDLFLNGPPSFSVAESQGTDTDGIS